MTDQRELILDMTQSLLDVCDGARMLDGSGFNRYDARFVRDVMGGEGDPTDAQVEALRKTIYKYKGQLSSCGYTEDEIKSLREPFIEEGDEDEYDADILIRDPHDTDYGRKFYVESPYECKEAVWDRLDFNKYHHTWNGDERAYEVDINRLPDIIETFQDAGYTVEYTDEVESEYEEETGFELNPEMVTLIVSEITGVQIEVQNGSVQTIDRPGEYDIVEGSQIVAKTVATEDSEVSIKYGIGEAEEKPVEIHVDEDGRRAKLDPSHVDDEIDDILDRELSFMVQNARHIDAVQRGDWDGRERLYNANKHSAPAGLVWTMKEVLEGNGYRVEVIDHRDVPEPDVDYEWDFEHDLREYQLRAVGQALERNGVINLPTGGGKTICALKVIQELGHRAIVLVHKKDLLHQWADEIRENLGVEPGVIGDDEWNEGDEITVAMLQTLDSRGVDDLDDYEVVVADEVHHVPASTFYKVTRSIDTYYKFGLSATAYRNDNKDLKIFAGVGDINVKVTAEELIEEGYLAEPGFNVIEWDCDYLESGNYHAQHQQMRESRKRNDAIVEKVEELVDRGHKVLVDVSRIAHGELLAQELDTDFVHGETKSEDRQEAVERFVGSEDGAVIVSTLLDEGVDIPQMTAIVLSDSGKSSIKVIQTIGRALRPLDGEKAQIYDMDDREAGSYMRQHFLERQRTMRDYYGEFYEREW